MKKPKLPPNRVKTQFTCVDLAAALNISYHAASNRLNSRRIPKAAWNREHFTKILKELARGT